MSRAVAVPASPAAATVGVIAGAVAGATWAINKNLGKDLKVEEAKPGQGDKA